MNENRFRVFDAAEFLDNEEIISAYIADAMNDNDSDALIDALKTVSRAREMSRLSEKAGIERKRLFEIFRHEVKPSCELIEKIASALDIDLEKLQNLKVFQTETVG